MSGYPTLLHTAIDGPDCRGLAEFYRELLGLRYREGDEPPTDASLDGRRLCRAPRNWNDIGYAPSDSALGCCSIAATTEESRSTSWPIRPGIRSVCWWRRGER